MGSLRLLLAFCVVLAHAGPVYGFTGMGGTAVPAFFIVSGFYMSLILTTKYGPGRTWLFYSNRALRLYPVYWFILLLFVPLVLCPTTGINFLDNVRSSAGGFTHFAIEGSFASYVAAVPNLTFFGADVFPLTLTDSTDGTMGLWRDAMTAAEPLRNGGMYMVIPPIWSLGVEVTFYLFAPLLNRCKVSTLALLFVAGGGLQIVIAYVSYALGAANWVHLIFLYNLPFFLMGMLAYKASPFLARLPEPMRTLLAVVPFGMVLGWQLFNYPQIPYLMRFLIWSIFAAGLSRLFALTNTNRWDNEIGNLSYPVYLVHMLFVFACLRAARKGPPPSRYRA